MDGTVLIADDDRTIRTVLTQAFTRAGCRVHATSSLMTLKRWVGEGKGDLVISDVMMPDGNGIDMLPEIHGERPGMPVIVISAQNTILTAVKATEARAFDYLPKPFDLPDLMTRASQALETKRRLPKKTAFKPAQADSLPLVGRAENMQELYRLIARVMNSDLPAVIEGESGTGKSLIARTVHALSDRRDHPFVVSTVEDFTTAEQAKAVFEQAERGTLVIEDVTELDLAAQGRLVRLLESKQDAPTGVLVTSQENLGDCAAAGSFRQDLFFRLTGIVLSVPPLRERVDDIPLLVDYFLGEVERESGTIKSISPQATQALRSFDWPGNVRQLAFTVRRLILTAPDTQITLDHVEDVLNTATRGASALGSGRDEKLSDSVTRHLTRYFDLHDGDLPPVGVYQRILREVEKPLIEIALDATAGNQAKCAELLGINRNTLRKKITELDILVTRRRKLM